MNQPIQCKQCGTTVYYHDQQQCILNQMNMKQTDLLPKSCLSELPEKWKEYEFEMTHKEISGRTRGSFGQFMSWLEENI